MTNDAELDALVSDLREYYDPEQSRIDMNRAADAIAALRSDLAAARELIVEVRSKWLHDRNAPTCLLDRIDAALSREQT